MHPTHAPSPPAQSDLAGGIGRVTSVPCCCVRPYRMRHALGRHTIIITGLCTTPAATRALVEKRLQALAIPYDALDWSRVDADLYVDASAVDALQGMPASFRGTRDPPTPTQP